MMKCIAIQLYINTTLFYILSISHVYLIYFYVSEMYAFLSLFFSTFFGVYLFHLIWLIHCNEEEKKPLLGNNKKTYKSNLSTIPELSISV